MEIQRENQKKVILILKNKARYLKLSKNTQKQLIINPIISLFTKKGEKAI